MRQAKFLGYAADSAEDGVKGPEKWQQQHFDAVLTDCNLLGIIPKPLTPLKLARMIALHKSPQANGASSASSRRAPIPSFTLEQPKILIQRIWCSNSPKLR